MALLWSIDVTVTQSQRASFSMRSVSRSVSTSKAAANQLSYDNNKCTCISVQCNVNFRMGGSKELNRK